MNFQDILKRRLQDIHGFAGGSLQDQLQAVARDRSGPYDDTNDDRVMSIPNGHGQYNDRLVTGNNEPLAYGDFRDKQAPEGYPQSGFKNRLNPQVLTATNREAITRPRTMPVPPSPIGANDGPPVEGTPEWQAAMSRAVPVRANEIPQPAASMADPNATRQRAVSFDTQTGKPNENFYRDRGDISGLYNAEQNWNPHGAKRGFKNSLKSAAMMAAEAVRNNPNHPLEAAIAGAGVGAIGGTAAPNFKNRLERQWKLQQTGGELQNQLQLEGEKAKNDALRAKPQQALDAEADKAIQRYNSIEHFDPNDPADAGLKAYFESRGLHGLPAKDKYHRPVVTWSNGRMLITDADGTRQATIDGSDEAVTDRGRTPNEAGLTPNQQAGIGESQANRTSRENQGDLNRKNRVVVAKIIAGAAGERAQADREASFLRQQKGFDNDAKEKGGTLIGQIARARGAMAAAADRMQRARDKGDTDAATDAERDYNDAKAYGVGAANDLNNGYGDLYEAGEGEGGFPYYKRKATNNVTPTVNTGPLDPKVKQYADKYFKGDYAAALKAIEAQRKGR